MNMKTFPFIFLSAILLFGVFLLASKLSDGDSSGVPLSTAAEPFARSLDEFPSVNSFPLGRYPGSIDARQSQPVVATVSGYFSFRPSAFEGLLDEGVVLGEFEHQLSVRQKEREFLSGEYSQLKERIELMGELERERRLRTMAANIATTREQLKLLKTVEANPDLEATLFSASQLGIPPDSTAESLSVSLQLLEAEYGLLQGEKGDSASEKRSFEVESKLSDLDQIIESLSLEMPFRGKFTPHFPEDSLDRAVPVRSGDVLGIATDTSAIFLNVVSTDPDLALIDGSVLAARVRAGGNDLKAEFFEKTMVQIQDRAVPVYRFRLIGAGVGVSDLVGSQVSCELLHLTDAPVTPISKLALVQLASEKGIPVGKDWGSVVEILFPGANIYAETRSELVLIKQTSI